MIKLTRDERLLLRKSANDEGTSESALIRRRIFGDAEALEDAPVIMTVTMDVQTARRLIGAPIKPKGG